MGVDASTDRPLIPSPAETWVQLNLGLVRQAGNPLPSARALFAHLEPLMAEWRQQRSLRWFFFMRKPPDVRLRFSTPQPSVVIATLESSMQELQQAGLIHTVFFSQYQPETDRFGGMAAMQAVHAYFDADTTLWMHLDRLAQQGLRTISLMLLVLAIGQDLFLRALGDPGSARMAWQRLHQLIPADPAAPVPDLNFLSLTQLQATIAPDSEEALILRRYTEANDILATALLHLQLQEGWVGELIDVLVAVVQFTLHRHGVDVGRSGPLIAALIQFLACVDSLSSP